MQLKSMVLICHVKNDSPRFVQYLDHNIRTLDGNGTFHGMGIIASITPDVKVSHIVPRENVTNKDISKAGQILIRFHKGLYHGMPVARYHQLPLTTAHDPTANLDILWKSSRSPRPAWSGMMQFVHHGNHPGKSSVIFLPIIDMNPSDTTCIYSTLSFVSEHAHYHSVTPVITFDQPLWWKALDLIYEIKLWTTSFQG